MPLDFAILNSIGAPRVTVGVGVDAHDAMMTLARKMKLQQLLRAENYYDDAVFSPDEVSELICEIEAACAIMTDKQSIDVWQDVRRLAATAVAEKNEVHVLAD